MRTHDEMLIEARRVEALGRDFAAEWRRAASHGGTVSPRILATFPAAHLTGVDGVRTRERWLEVAMENGALDYRLLEAEREETASGELVGEVGPVYFLGSDSAFDVIDEGEQLVEKDRLGEALAPFMARAEKEEFVDSIDPAVVEQIEDIVAAGDLTPVARLHTKANIIDLLEGRLDPSEFISATIERQRWRECQHEVIAERTGERMVIGEP